MLVELVVGGILGEAEDDAAAAAALSVLAPLAAEAAEVIGAAEELVCLATAEVRLVDGSGLMTRYVCVAVTVVVSRSVIVVLVRAMIVAAGKVIVAWVAALPPSTGTTEYFACVRRMRPASPASWQMDARLHRMQAQDQQIRWCKAVNAS